MRFWLALVLAVLLPAMAGAQAPVGRPGAQGPSDKGAAMAQMLDALKEAPSEEVSGALEARLRKMQFEASTPAVTLLMGRGLRDISSGQYDDAVEVFTDALILDPNLPEAWHQRAVAKFRGGDVPGAVRDIEETLKRDPRSFAAFRTLTEIAVAREDYKAAYAAWQKVLEITPQTPGGAERLKDLRRKAFGQEA